MNEHNTHAAWRRLPVAKLTPAAARLLLALSTIEPNESIDDPMERSGIYDMRTYLAARKQLIHHGFIVWREGREYITMYAQEPVARLTEDRYTYPGATVVTKAVQ